MADSETKSPAEEREERFDSLRTRWKNLSNRVALGHLYDEIEDMGSEITGLAHCIQDLRQCGYVYSRGWEDRAEALRKSWPERERNARRIVKERVHDLKDMVEDIDELCDRKRLSDSSLDQLDHQLDRIESRLNGAESDVRGAFDTFGEQLAELRAEFEMCEYMLTAINEASFKLYPDERGVAACEATWVSDREEPKGVLFLTNGRLVFEQREKKALKKVLFITTKSETIQKQLWETPVGAIADIEAEDKKKFLGRKELLHLSFRERTRELPGDVTLHLHNATNEAWMELLKRVQSSEIEMERYDVVAASGTQGPVAATTPAMPAAAIPTKCPSCGGQLPTVYKGMQEITCDYCGTVIRL